jgi:hypothetical protein
MCSSALAATYYVDPNGNDTSGNGTQTSPWKTLSTACNHVTSSGNTIYINPGTYTDNNTCKLAIGVNIQGAGSDRVLIKSAYNGAIGTAYIYRQNANTNPVTQGNNEISGFTLDGSSKTLVMGIFIRGSDNLNIHNLKLQNIKVTALRVDGYYDWTDGYNTPPPAYGKNVVIHDIETADTTTVTDYGWGPRLGAIALAALENAQVYNLTINENIVGRGVGIKNTKGWLKGFKGYNWTINTDVSNGDAFVFEIYNFLGDSEIYDCTFNHALSLNGGLKTPITGSTWNLKIHDTKTDFSKFPTHALGHELSHNYLDFYNNYIYGNKGRGAGLWTTNYSTGTSVNNWRFRNNVVYNCAAGGLSIEKGGSMSNIQVFNNVFDSISNSPYGGYGISTEGFSGTLSGLKIQNNLIMNCLAAPVSVGSKLTSTLIDHNFFYGNGNGNGVKNAGSGTAITNNITSGAPGIMASGSRPTQYYQLTGSSNLLNTGINVGLPYNGTAPNIGAYGQPKLPLPPTNLTVS